VSVQHHPHPLSYFTRVDRAQLDLCADFPGLLKIALRVLHRMPIGATMVCGPISTGGAGSIEKNLEIFALAIEALASRGENVFSQMPFERTMQRLKTTNLGLLNDFYLPLFRSGRIRRLCFLDGWESSEGATWEYERAIELGFEIEEFRSDFHLLLPEQSTLSLFKASSINNLL